MRVLLLLLMIITIPVGAEQIVSEKFVSEPEKEKSWWQKRDKRTDIYYPHKVHFEVMEREGDSCLLCHPFNKNSVTNIKQYEKLNAIANESLEAICHECHVTQLSAPSNCELCHDDPKKIWPKDHNLDYISHHGEDARLDSARPEEDQCGSCHIDLSFCSDCHFRRGKTKRREHSLGYRASHGIDARMSAASCSRCHNINYCSDCHRRSR